MTGKRPDRRGQGLGQGPAKGAGRGNPKAPNFTSETGRKAAMKRWHGTAIAPRVCLNEEKP